MTDLKELIHGMIAGAWDNFLTYYIDEILFTPSLSTWEIGFNKILQLIRTYFQKKLISQRLGQKFPQFLKKKKPP